MDLQAYIDEIKLKITGGVLDLEIDDNTLTKIVNSALREIQRYIDTTYIVTIPFARCISLDDYNIKPNAIARIRRSEGYVVSGGDNSLGYTDPMLASQWQLLSGTGNLYNFQDYALSYASWNTILQIRNTTSTDLAFYYDKERNQLYTNIATDYPEKITIEYVPRFDNVEEIKSDFWIDSLLRLAVAITKVTLGRIRSKYKQSNSLLSLDGDTLLEEGNKELDELRTYLQTNTQLSYGID